MAVSVAVAVVASVRNFVAFAIDKDLWNEIESVAVAVAVAALQQQRGLLRWERMP